MPKPRTGSAKRASDTFELPTWEKGTQVRTVLAVDPGAVNCGMALLEEDANSWTVQAAWKFGPFECVDHVESFVADSAQLSPCLVVESFRLYPGKMSEQGFSAMGTPQVIGAIRYVAARENWHRQNKGKPLIPVVMQQASTRIHGCQVLEGTCATVPGKGIHHDASVHLGKNIHARDAEAHGVFFVAKKVGALQQLKLPGLAGA